MKKLLAFILFYKNLLHIREKGSRLVNEKKNCIFPKWEVSTSIFLPCFFLPSFPPSHVCCYHISGTDGDISACFLWNFRTVGKIDLIMPACIIGVRLQLWYVPPGGVLGTPSTWNLDPSWDDGDRGASLRKWQLMGGVNAPKVKEVRESMFQAERPAREKSARGRESATFCSFEEMRNQKGWKMRARMAWCRMWLGICVGPDPLWDIKVSVWLKSTSKIFSRNLATLELERSFHINVWKAYWSWVMEEMGRLVWRLLSRQRWFCLEVQWWQWGWTTMGWRHSGGKTNSTRQWGGCRKVSRMGLRFTFRRATWYHWVEKGI